MKNKNLILLIILVVLSTLSFTIHAEQESVAISLASMDFEYEETDIDGTFLDGEYGYLGGFSIDYNRELQNNTLARFSFEYYRGTVDYDGHLQSVEDPPDLNIDMLPFESETEETVFILSAYLAKQISTTLPLSFYGKFSYKNWERDIQGRRVMQNGNLGNPIDEFVPDLYEEYSWWQLDAGLHYQHEFASRLRLELYGGFLQTINPTMEIGPYELDLEEKMGYEAGFKFFYTVSPGKRLGIGSYFTHWEFGRSNTLFISPTQTILEPDSESNMRTVKVTFEWDLKQR